MRKLVVLSGAGISAESGLGVFRGSGGLWQEYKIEDVATPEAWQRNRDLVLEFYNLRRKGVLKAKPNQAHSMLAELEKEFEIDIVTQNIDDLHERAGSTRVLHLHGEILKSQSSFRPNLVYEMDSDIIEIGDKCELGSQLRPHVVWFGEAVPMLEVAAEIVSMADILLIIGTSLQVYPASGLVNYAPPNAQVYVIDPNSDELSIGSEVICINKNATEGMEDFVNSMRN